MLNNFKQSNTIKMEAGEELLGKEYSINVKPGTETILVGLDCGSTQTRCVVLKPDEGVEELDKVYVIPSPFSGIQSYEEIISQGPILYDNMDSWITCSSSEPDGLFDKIRVLRGTKKADANVSTNRINSTKQKIDTPAFYLNAIDSIAYSLIQKGGDLSKEYDVYLGMTLPPDNVTSTINRDLFFRRMIRSYDFENKDLGCKIKINIKGVELQTEPEAVLRAYRVKYSETSQDERDKIAMLVEVGGSTVGIAIIKGHITVKAAAKTFNYGGTQLQDALGILFSEEFGGGNLNQNQLKSALENGLLKSKGRGVVDVSNLCIESKKQFASRIHSDLYTNVFDQLGNSDIDMVDIEEVFFSGRTCLSGKYSEDNESGFSITQPLTELLKKDLPDAEYIHVAENLIPYGNALRAYARFEEELFPEEDSVDNSENENIESENEYGLE